MGRQEYMGETFDFLHYMYLRFSYTRLCGWKLRECSKYLMRKWDFEEWF